MFALKYVTSVLKPGNRKEFRAVCTGKGFLQFLHALGECGTVQLSRLQRPLEVRLFKRSVDGVK